MKRILTASVLACALLAGAPSLALAQATVQSLQGDDASNPQP